MRTVQTSIFVSLVVGATGCPTDDGLLPPVQVEGRYLSYAADDDLVVCGGTVPLTEAWMDAVAFRLGMDPDLILATTYYLAEPSLLADECSAEASGCADREGEHIQIFAMSPIHQHELVHGIHLSVWPSSAILLREGLAQAFVQDFPPAYAASFTPDEIDAAIEAEHVSENGNSVYLVGHHLVYWMLTRYDVEAFEQFWHATSQPTSAAEFRSDFEEIFGESLDQMQADVDGLPYCAISVCVGDLVAWTQGTWTTESPTSCDDDSVVGVVGGKYHEVRRDDLLEVAAAGMYDVSVSENPNPGAGTIVMSCENGCAQEVIWAGQSRSVEFVPGVYRVSTFFSGPDDPGVRVDIEPSN